MESFYLRGLPCSIYDDDYVPVQLQVYGLANAKETAILSRLVDKLWRRRPESLAKEPEIILLFEFEWTTFLNNLKARLQGGDAWMIKSDAILMCDSCYVGDAAASCFWMSIAFDCELQYDKKSDNKVSVDLYKNAMKSKNNSFVYFDIRHGNEAIGRMIFELYNGVVPLTCQNFQLVCSGSSISLETTPFTYKGSEFHRVVPNGWIQGGDIADSCGSNSGETISRWRMYDENYVVKHDRRGILSLVGDCRHTQLSQFIITLGPCMSFQFMYVAFGQLVEGSAVLDYMEKVPTENERPLQALTIESCGVLLSAYDDEENSIKSEPSGDTKFWSFSFPTHCYENLQSYLPTNTKKEPTILENIWSDSSKLPQNNFESVSFDPEKPNVLAVVWEDKVAQPFVVLDKIWKDTKPNPIPLEMRIFSETKIDPEPATFLDELWSDMSPTKPSVLEKIWADHEKMEYHQPFEEKAVEDVNQKPILEMIWSSVPPTPSTPKEEEEKIDLGGGDARPPTPKVDEKSGYGSGRSAEKEKKPPSGKKRKSKSRRR